MNITVKMATIEHFPLLYALLTDVWGSQYPAQAELKDLLQDQRSGFLIALLDGEVVGCLRISPLTKDEWWLSAAAVGRNLRHTVAFGKLWSVAIARFQTSGGLVLRAMIDSSHSSLLRAASRAGFSTVLELHHVVAPSEEGTHGFEVIHSADHHWAASFIKQSSFLQASHGLLEHRWHFVKLSDRLVAEMFSSSIMLRWREGSGLACVSVHEIAREKQLRIWYADARDLSTMIREIRHFAAGMGTDLRINWRVPENAQFLQCVLEAGFRRRSSYSDRFKVIEYCVRPPTGLTK